MPWNGTSSSCAGAASTSRRSPRIASAWRSTSRRSCQTRNFCPSCQAKRAALLGERLVEDLFAPVPHVMWTLTIPKALRGLFPRERKLLGILSRSAYEALLKTTQAALERKDARMRRLDPDLRIVRSKLPPPRPHDRHGRCAGRERRVRAARRHRPEGGRRALPPPRPAASPPSAAPLGGVPPQLALVAKVGFLGAR